MASLFIKQSNGRYRPATEAEVRSEAATYLVPKKIEDALISPEVTAQYLIHKIGWSPDELFVAVYVDNRHRVLDTQVLFRGTIDGSSVHPRVVVRSVLEHNAAAVIFAHNHPSGVLEPSQADLRITARLKESLALIDVRVLDHIIVGSGDGYCSFAERGML